MGADEGAGVGAGAGAEAGAGAVAGAGAGVGAGAGAGRGAAGSRAGALNLDQTKCVVCSDKGDDDDDPLFSCRGCGMWAHLHCYGPDYVGKSAAAIARAKAARPAPAFTCAVCAAGVEHSNCVVCNLDVTRMDTELQRAAKIVVKGIRAPRNQEGAARDRWVHIFCALWTPGIEFDDAKNKDRVVFLKDAMKPIADCLLCQVPKGQVIQCWHPGCLIAFHAVCCRGENWEMDVVDGDTVQMRAYCGAHSRAKHLEMANLEDLECDACGKGDRETEIVLCDGPCNRGWHYWCCTPKLDAVPGDEQWFCADCADDDVDERAPAPVRVERKQQRGFEVPNTYFGNVNKRILTEKGARVPPFVSESAVKFMEDSMQSAWCTAAAKADVDALVSTYVPLLVGVRAALTVSSVGDALPAAWHLAASWAATTASTLMLVDFSVDDITNAGPKSLHAGALVLTNIVDAHERAWVALGDADLLIFILRDSHDLLRIPPDLLRGRMTVRLPRLYTTKQRIRRLSPHLNTLPPLFVGALVLGESLPGQR